MSIPVVETKHRWWVLATVALAQLMVVLDATIVNIAMPSAQADLGFSDNDRQWVVTAYALAFGSLLLLGGRLADMFGRRRMFLIGLVGFAVASALGGAAQSFELLVAARALQGAFAAVLAPAALSVLTTTFTAGQGAGPRVRRVRRDRRHGRRHRPDARRLPDRELQLALEPLRQRVHRGVRVRRRHACCCPRRSSGTTTTSTCRASCSRRAACSCWSSGSRRPSPRAGTRRSSGAPWPSAWSCSSAS